MTQDQLDRIAELEEVKEAGEELDEEERTELRELRETQRQEKRRSKAMAAWAKAQEVYRLNIAHDDQTPSYALTPKAIEDFAKVYGWEKGEWSAEKVARPAFENVGYDSYQEIYFDADAENV